MEKFHQEISTPKSVIKSNGYPRNLIVLCIKKMHRLMHHSTLQVVYVDVLTFKKVYWKHRK